MPPRFRPGAVAYTKDGRRYSVEEVDDGIVYCISDNGAETEFAEAGLFNEAEWAAKSGSRLDRIYGTIKQSKAHMPYKGRMNRAGAEKLLAKAEILFPRILDYTAFVSSERILADAGHAGAGADITVAKCREIFDAATPETRVALLAGLIGSPPDVLGGAAEMGDNLLRAMIGKATTAGTLSLEEFRNRRRR